LIDRTRKAAQEQFFKALPLLCVSSKDFLRSLS
jgi:hypothetical protein